jgi:NADPH:quinone reductase-like Zn-dependent oxidoreductase
VGLVKSLGADHVIDYYQEDFTESENRYDLVYDTIGKSSFKESRRVLKPQGIYLSPVLHFPLLWDMFITSFSGGKKARFEATGTNSHEKLRNMLKEVLSIYTAGKLKTVIDRQFPLEKLADAHRYIDSGHKKGNVVICKS